MSTENNALAKAHSASALLGRMGKAVDDFHEKLGKLHKVHHDDMKECFTKMHKILGVEETGDEAAGEPKAGDLTTRVPNELPDFGKLISESIDKALAKAGITPATPPAAEPAAAAPAAEVMITMEKANAMITAGVTDAMKQLVKALGKKKDEGEDDEDDEDDEEDDDEDDEDDDEDKRKEKARKARKAAKAAAAAGIGNRQQVQQPVIKAVVPTTKAGDDGTAVVQQPTGPMDAQTVQKALNGDPESLRKMMATAKPADMPNTLTDVMAKVH